MAVSMGANPGFKIFTVWIVLLGIWGFALWTTPCEGADELYESRLDRGLSTTEPYSYLLILKAQQEPANAKDLLKMARQYSPDLPAVYFALARERLSTGDIFQAIESFREGTKAYGRNFWWEFSLAGLFYSSMLISFALSLALVLTIRLFVDAALVSHDGMEDRRRLVFVLVPVVLAVFGPIALIAGTFFLIGIYFKKENKAVVYTALLFFLFSPTLLNIEGKFSSAPSPGLRAMVDVNEGKDNKYALWAIKGQEDFASRFSHALALKREGSYKEAIEGYRSLLGGSHRSDPRLLVNLGNAYYAVQDRAAAEDSYQKALQYSPLPSAYYNLSQLHREMLDFGKGDEYFLEAAKLNPEAVSRFTSRSGTGQNRFVMDEMLPVSAFWENALGTGNAFLYSFPPLTTLMAVIMIPFFYLLNKRTTHRAQRCKRCSAVFCSRCSRVIAWGEMCPQCYSSLIRMDEVDSKERITRLLSIYESQTRRRKRAKLLSYILPGAGQIYSGKILLGLLLLWPFSFSLILCVMNQLPVAGILPFSHVWITPLALVLMLVTYLFSILHIGRGIYKGWL
jgi:tetratricopeptide (TPR) repeat protein